MERFFICLLIDFYGGLLTPNQRKILKLYYEDDLSLGEIAKDLGISRQAVHYTLKRGLSRLKKVEEKLNLVEKFLVQTRAFDEIRKELLSLCEDLSGEKRKRLKGIIDNLDNLLGRGGMLV